LRGEFKRGVRFSATRPFGRSGQVSPVRSAEAPAFAMMHAIQQLPQEQELLRNDTTSPCIPFKGGLVLWIFSGLVLEKGKVPPKQPNPVSP